MFRDITPTIMDLANGEVRTEAQMAALVKAREETALTVWDESQGRTANPSDGVSVLEILRVVARHVLDQAIMGVPNIVYCNQVSALGFHRGDGSYSPLRFGTMAKLLPIPGLDLGGKEENDVQISLRMFNHLVENGTLSPERVGKCHCGRYFLSVRLGQRKSRACSKAHQAVLTARGLRSSPAYLKKENEKNARRMAAVREGEKLMIRWIEEGRKHCEREGLLREWNEKNNSVLGKRALNNILEKGI